MSSLPLSLTEKMNTLRETKQFPELMDWEQNRLPAIQEEVVTNLLCHLDTHKSMGPERIHSRVLRELVEELSKPPFIIYHLSLLMGEVPDAVMSPVVRGGRENDASGPDLPVGFVDWGWQVKEGSIPNFIRIVSFS